MCVSVTVGACVCVCVWAVGVCMQFHVLIYVNWKKNLGCHKCIWVSAGNLVVSAWVSVFVCRETGLECFYTHTFSNQIYLPRLDCSRMAAAFHLSIYCALHLLGSLAQTLLCR